MAINQVNKKLRLKVIRVPTKPTKSDIMVAVDTEESFIYRIEVVANLAYIFYDERKFR